MAMVTNKETTMLNNLKPYKTAWKVEVKVVHSWTHHSNYYGDDTFEFILEDKMGSEIHCTCKKVFLARVKRLQVGQWIFLENFSVCAATVMYRPTSHRYKMSITENSIVTNSTLTTCEISFEDVSTSSSKRKEVDADLNDINSTSKK